MISSPSLLDTVEPDRVDRPLGLDLGRRRIEIAVDQHIVDNVPTNMIAQSGHMLNYTEIVGLSTLRRDVADIHFGGLGTANGMGDALHQEIGKHRRVETSWTKDDQIGRENRDDRGIVRVRLPRIQEDPFDLASVRR